VKVALPLLIVVLVLWLVAGILLAGHLAARHDTAASATFASVGKVVAGVLDEVRFEAALLAQDPVVVEGTMRSDWASLGQGVWPWIVTLTQDRLADLLLIVDGSGAPLVQVPTAPGAEAPAVARPDAPVARLDVVDEQPYVLGIAPMTAGMVVVGRRFDSLAGAIAGLPARVALVMVSGDRALGSTLPDAPPLDWAGAMRSGLVTIRGEPWFARPLGETGGRLWALVSARDQRGENRQLWFWWTLSLLAAGGAAVGIAAVGGPGGGGRATASVKVAPRARATRATAGAAASSRRCTQSWWRPGAATTWPSPPSGRSRSCAASRRSRSAACSGSTARRRPWCSSPIADSSPTTSSACVSGRSTRATSAR
jgi:hypothetical protein